MNAPFSILVLSGFGFVVGSLIVACNDASTQAPSKRLFLLTCDTLRADRLGAYGYDRPVSPNLDALADQSLLFERAYSSAASTVPAMSSLLSGRLPDEIGVSGGNQTLMHPGFVTLAELAGEAGLATGAIVSNWVLRRQPGRSDAGVSQGFGFYDDRMDQMEGVRAVPERRGDSTTLAATKWLRDRKRLGEDNFFLWVHYQDPHGPYDPSAQDLDLLQREAADAPAEETQTVKLGTNTSGKRQIPDYQIIDGEARPFFYLDRYDAEIRTFDRALGKLLDEIRSLGWFDNSLILFTADHGESLGENDYWFCHGQSLSDEVVRV
ncbi:MAG: arylsulfatase A-like enzyme, partial [Planctomycetota bacterium]